MSVLTLHGHPLAKELESWWAEHGQKPSDPAWIAWVNDYGTLLIDKLIEISEEHTNGGRFGMSRAGGCTRAAALKVLGYEPEPLTGSKKVTFAIGHDVEILTLATLRAVGIAVSDFQSPAVIEPFMQSAVDGVVVKAMLQGDDGVERDTIVSIKSVGYKMSGFDFKTKKWRTYGFAQYPVDGLLKTAPGYYAQVQAEMHARGTEQALFVVVAKDMIQKMMENPSIKANGSGSFYTELVAYDAAFCADQLIPTWRKQWEHVVAGEPGPAMTLSHHTTEFVELNPSDEEGNKLRVFGPKPDGKSQGYSQCDYCDFRAECVSATLTSSLHASIAQAQAEAQS